MFNSKIKLPLEIARPVGRQFQPLGALRGRDLSPGNSTNFSGQKSKLCQMWILFKRNFGIPMFRHRSNLRSGQSKIQKFFKHFKF